MSVDQRWNKTERDKQQKNLSHCHIINHRFHTERPGIKHKPVRGDRLATNNLHQGVAMSSWHEGEVCIRTEEALMYASWIIPPYQLYCKTHCIWHFHSGECQDYGHIRCDTSRCVWNFRMKGETISQGQQIPPVYWCPFSETLSTTYHRPYLNTSCSLKVH